MVRPLTAVRSAAGDRLLDHGQRRRVHVALAELQQHRVHRLRRVTGQDRPVFGGHERLDQLLPRDEAGAHDLVGQRHRTDRCQPGCLEVAVANAGCRTRAGLVLVRRDDSNATLVGRSCLAAAAVASGDQASDRERDKHRSRHGKPACRT